MSASQDLGTAGVEVGVCSASKKLARAAVVAIAWKIQDHVGSN